MKFLDILPDREEIDVEFDAVLLAPGRYNTDGWYKDGVIAICAWEKEMQQTYSKEYFEEHKDLFIRLGVEYELKNDFVVCYFAEKQIKAYQLLHVFLHELGHHHDRIHTKSKNKCARGEDYAESYAFKYEEIIWNRYFEKFLS